MFQLSDLSKSFGGRALFRGVTWRVNPGDRWGLVGPNGVGKTTLLKMFVGLESSDTGSVTRPKEAKIGYLAQEVRREGAGSVLEQVCAAIPEAGEVEREMRAIEAELAGTAPGARADELTAIYGDLQDRFHALDGFSVATRAKEILAGLGFGENDFGKTLDQLSGGWGMRVALARLLLARPDLLLLDEPTNHLDLESVVWLESFLADYHGAWVVVSHDRYFLNRMVDGIAELTSDGIELYAGSYDDYLEENAARVEQKQRAADAQARRIAEMEKFVERFRYKATKARQAQSRLKALAKIERLDAPKRAPRRLSIRLPDPPRSGETAVSIERGGKKYGETNVVYRDLAWSARRGERIALVGPNGAGKSTLLKLLAGVTALDAGHVRLGHNVERYYYAQHQADALDGSLTVLETMRRTMPLEGESTVRGILGAFLFPGDDVDKKVSVLSGGEKARLALAQMLARPSNLLLLDEPTNHLDLASREVLEGALAAFAGTMVFISHDRYFINSIASKIVEVRRPGEGAPAEVVEYGGDYDYWQWKRAQELDLGTREAAGSAKRDQGRKDDWEKKKAAKREEDKKKRAIAELEKEIDVTEQRMKEIDGLLADASVYADAARAKSLLDERRDLEEKLEPLMKRWESASV